MLDDRYWWLWLFYLGFMKITLKIIKMTYIVWQKRIRFILKKKIQTRSMVTKHIAYSNSCHRYHLAFYLVILAKCIQTMHKKVKLKMQRIAKKDDKITYVLILPRMTAVKIMMHLGIMLIVLWTHVMFIINTILLNHTVCMYKASI